MNIEFVKSFKESNYFNFANDYIGNDTYNGSKTMYYTIYEDDNWPAGERIATFDRIGGGTIEIQYRSADDFYEKNTLFSADGPFWSQINWNAAPPSLGINRSNSEITYRMKVLP